MHAGMPGLPGSLVELIVGEASWQAGPLLICHAILLEPQSTQLPGSALKVELLQAMS